MVKIICDCSSYLPQTFTECHSEDKTALVYTGAGMTSNPLNRQITCQHEVYIQAPVWRLQVPTIHFFFFFSEQDKVQKGKV